MKVPGASDAVVPEEKLRDYLLSTSHPVGAAKAKFFRARGFDEREPERLVRALLALVGDEEASSVESSPHGTKYVVDGDLQLPGGGSVRVRSVWICERGADRPRFVTAYPV